jgi:hypothetical protein
MKKKQYKPNRLLAALILFIVLIALLMHNSQQDIQYLYANF